MQHTKTFFCGLLVALLTLSATRPAGAEIFTIPTPRPATFADTDEAVARTREFLKTNAMCGGSETGRSVGGEPGDGSAIARVDGVPGRDGTPLTEDGTPMASGMAERGDAFRFPDVADGLMTSCVPGMTEVSRLVWEDPRDGDPGRFVEQTFTSDEGRVKNFSDTPCNSPDGCAAFCEELNDFTYDDCRRFDNVWVKDEAELDGQGSPVLDAGGRPVTRETELARLPVEAEQDATDAGTHDDPGQDPALAPWTVEGARVKERRCADDGIERKGICSEQWVDRDPRDPGRVPILNCMPCAGTQCRCSLPDAGLRAPQTTCPVARGEEATVEPAELPREDPPPGPGRADKIFFSFYREYSAETARDRFEDPERDDSDILDRVAMPVACYGFYEEFDPLTHKTEDRDRRCVIALPETFERLRETQSVIGKTGPRAGDIDDPAPEAAPFDDDTDVWRQVPGGMSFPDEKALGRQGGELTSLFLRPAAKRQTAIWQKTENEPLAKGGTPLATDDTVRNGGEGRPFTEWIGTLQTGMTELLSPATVRMRVPADWVTGTGEGRSAEESPDEASSRTLSVNERVDAGNDLPGDVLDLVGRYFRMEEEKIPVVIPLASTREISAVLAQWEDWVRVQDARAKPTGIAREIIGKLADYRDQIDRYRALRAELGRTAVALLGRQADDAAALTDWMAENAARYRAFLAKRDEQLRLTPLVRGVQRTLAEFSDVINMPWCRNDLLTTPVYSLNDGWNISRPELFGEISCDGEEGTWPALCIPPQRDFVLDLTRFAARAAPLRIPVIDPVQVLIDLPHPPANDADADTIAPLPDLPPVPGLDAGFGGQLRVTVASRPEPIAVPPEEGPGIDLDRARAALESAERILRARNDDYKKFWDSLRPGGEIDDGNRSDRLACGTPGEAACVHTEMDLKERIQRIVAMPGILLREHAQPTSAAKDIVRAPPLHEEVHPPSTGWQVIFPAERRDDAAFSALRASFRRQMIGDDGKSATDLPFVAPELKHLFDVPPDISLTPDNDD